MKKIIFIFTSFLLIFLVFRQPVEGWIPGGTEGKVEAELPDGTRIPLPGVKIFRVDYSNYYYCNPPGSKCFGEKDGVETITDQHGRYSMKNDGNNPPPVCANENGATHCPTGERGKITPYPCPVTTPIRSCLDSQNTQLCPGVYSYSLNWCGFNCGSNPHRWCAYFPDNYHLPGNLESLGYSISNGYWSDPGPTPCYTEDFNNSEIKKNKNFSFKLNQPPSPTPTPTPTNTPTSTPNPTNTPIPTNTSTPPPTNTPTPTPTYIPVQLPTLPPNQTAFGTPRPSQTWICLHSETYDGPIKPENHADHRLKLTGDGFPFRKQIYIVGCVQVGASAKCTTGDQQLDQKLDIEKHPTHIFIVDGFNPITVSENGHLEKIVYSRSTQSTIHSFYGVFFNLNAGGNNKTRSTIQYSTFESINSQYLAECVAVRWDPYGQVFDGKTLKPIPNVEITLLDEKGNLVQLPGLKNPTITDNLGRFHFLVKPGKYTLKVNPPKGYRFIKNPKIPPPYQKYYPNIYQPQMVIEEKPGTPLLANIPLFPESSFLKKIVSFFKNLFFVKNLN